MDNCAICQEREAEWGLSAPMFNGQIVDPSTTTEWAGMQVCRPCYEESLREISQMRLREDVRQFTAAQRKRGRL
jgi:hypothetical protein